MAKIKSYTDLQQSKKLAEILPIESADMSWASNGLGKPFARTIPIKGDPEELCACWSLAALLSVLPKTINFGYENDSIFVLKPLKNGKYLANYYEVSFVKDNPVDACVAMVEKLHELNLL